MTTTSSNDNDKEADGSDEECVVATERDFKRQVPQPNENFEKLLESACPNPE
jgi:hypothetical protein